MPLLLTTPFEPGDLDPGAHYTHLKVEWFAMLVPDLKLELVTTYGTQAGAVYTKGVASPNKKYDIAGPDFFTMVQKLPHDGETIYNAAARELYEWLIAKGHAAGTIV